MQADLSNGESLRALQEGILPQFFGIAASAPRVPSLFLPSSIPETAPPQSSITQSDTLAHFQQRSVYTAPRGAPSAVPIRGDVLLRREEMDLWDAQLQALELRCQKTGDLLRQKTAEAAANHKKWLQERRTNDAQRELEDEKDKLGRLHKDKKDLAETIEDDRAKAVSKVKAYKKNLKGMGDLQSSLTDELAAARLAKKEAKDLFRQQLSSIQKEQEALREEAAQHRSVVQGWMEKVTELRQEGDALMASHAFLYCTRAARWHHAYTHHFYLEESLKRLGTVDSAIQMETESEQIMLRPGNLPADRWSRNGEPTAAVSLLAT
ncbi:hypothetical protein BESB_054260 [Besnoitia besnoiti]|uniref:Uncharacterized protein n=1 Tax=Besnoitia besnoiti TaxID=94643 RepID=A0A2A9MCQ6_BESBE|nr:hypothetical protein BESB_054260 [Besnoitia besnoiti]PFH35775.1 hypothetical protein BESB_054260 [Besnoitia besnoiti]